MGYAPRSEAGDPNGLEDAFHHYDIDPTQILSYPLAILGSGLQPGSRDGHFPRGSRQPLGAQGRTGAKCASASRRLQ